MTQQADVGLTAESDTLVAQASSAPQLRVPFRDMKAILAIRFGERFMGMQQGWLIFEAAPISVACDARKCPGAQQVIFRDQQERINVAGILRQADAARRPRNSVGGDSFPRRPRCS
jgi:hypothetical protein